MEKLYNGFTLELSSGAFPLSTDSVALAGFVQLHKNATVLDLGSGCGTLGLMLCAKSGDCSVTGIEIDPDCHQMALQNARQNDIASRLNSICADVCDVPASLKPGSFSVCISNPPYFTDGPRSKTVPTARCEDLLPLEKLFQSAAWALRYGGDFYIVHRPERLAELIARGNQYKLEAKQLQLLRHRADGPVALILLKFRKGGRPGLKWDEQFLWNTDGSPSDYYKHLYHI